VGAAKRMHTVLAALCTGCDLCVPPCPMDCIAMLPIEPAREWSADDARAARQRFETRERRLARERAEAEMRRTGKTVTRQVDDAVHASDAEARAKKARVAAAIERARERRKTPVDAGRTDARKADR